MKKSPQPTSKPKLSAARRLIVFNNVSLDGYFTDASGQMGWAHSVKPDPEFQSFVAGNASGKSVLVFGRKTYELMASYWPTAAARQMSQTVADGMNQSAKLVFSKTLKRAERENTRLVKGDVVTEIRKLKAKRGPNLVILGSGSLVAQLAAADLVDEYQFVLIALALGAGRTLFNGLPHLLKLRLTESRPFANGNVFLRYQRP